jgi:dTDP-4-dehydrorhamnose reductase
VSRRLLVTGATGYLGRALCTVASTAGWDVMGVSSADADIRDRRAVDALVRPAAPDAVIHTAYVKDGPAARAVIVDGTANVANAARAVGARVVHVSSDVVFDGRAGRPYREPDDLSPVNDYGRAKAIAEHLVHTIAPSALVVRTSLIYGGPDGPASMHEENAHDPTATFYEDEVRCPVQVDDLATALVELAGSELAGIIHVAGPEAVSRHQFAELITGRPVRHAPAPPGRPLDCRLDTTLAQATLATVLRGVSEVYAR